MTRWRLLLEYDGVAFAGWQRQENAPSVQAAVEEAVFAFSGERVLVQGAGRTDAGVHATGQVAHLDLEKTTTAHTLRDAVNHHLRPQPVAILSAALAGPEFHARFSARGRRYLYRILDRRAPAVLERGRVWWTPRSLDVNAMQAAAQRLIGRHDFTSFRAAACQAASPIKTLDRLEVRRADGEIHIEAAARSFLHHQVRNLVGTLQFVGCGKWQADAMSSILTARDRRAAGPTAPPEGLYLTGVLYDCDAYDDATGGS